MLLLFDGDLGARETLRFIEEKLGAGIWSWDLLSGNMQWSHGFFSLLGVEPDSDQTFIYYPFADGPS